MGNSLKNEYNKREEEIQNAELYALIEILKLVKPRPLELQPINWKKIIDNVDNTIRLLEQKIERKTNG